MKKIVKGILIFIAIIVISPFVTGLLYSPNNNIPENYIGNKVEINGRMMRYYQTGNGENILFIHGSMGSVEDWEKLYPLLKDKYRVTAIDRPGMGFSDMTHIASDMWIEVIPLLLEVKDIFQFLLNSVPVF